jgi:hypothetical protein
LRASKGIGAALLAWLLTAASGVSAHRLDEYLHAARLSIDSAGVELELSLTPGTAVADAVIRDIDADGDAVLSAAERSSYARRILGALSLRLDDGAVPLQLTASHFPAALALRSGEAPIVLRIDARPPQLGPGAHRVSFRNGNATHGAVYLANALIPEDRGVAITSMQHAMDQSGLTVDFTLRLSLHAR